jgi:hypothetical protein
MVRDAPLRRIAVRRPPGRTHPTQGAVDVMRRALDEHASGCVRVSVAPRLPHPSASVDSNIHRLGCHHSHYECRPMAPMPRGLAFHPLPDDEAWISRAIGLPGWLLPYSLGAIAIAVLIATVRLHPPKSRFMPFLGLGVGGVLGSLLWMELVGPALLP